MNFFIFYVLSTVLERFSQVYDNSYALSCYQADNVVLDNTAYCNHVTWGSARALSFLSTAQVTHMITGCKVILR
jgi:hypothetical protein